MIINNSNLTEDNQIIELKKEGGLWSKAELRMMITDCRKKKIINIDVIKFGKKIK